jgi:hypothetical protein
MGDGNDLYFRFPRGGIETLFMNCNGFRDVSIFRNARFYYHPAFVSKEGDDTYEDADG